MCANPRFTLPAASSQQKSRKSWKTWRKTELPNLTAFPRAQTSSSSRVPVPVPGWVARLAAASPTGCLAQPRSLCGARAGGGQHPSPHATPPFPAAGLTSPLGTGFRCGQMAVREGTVLFGSDPAGLQIAVPLPAGVGTGQRGESVTVTPLGTAASCGRTPRGCGQGWVWPAQG